MSVKTFPIIEDWVGVIKSPKVASTPDVVKKTTRKRKDAIMERVEICLENCLNAQRDRANSNPEIKKFRAVNPHTQVEEMKKKQGSLFYYLQRAFSIPEDYCNISPNAEEWDTTRHIESLVFHPGLLSESFLLGLDICKKEEFYRKSEIEKLQKKIDMIPVVKNILAQAHPLPFHLHGTGRILSTDDQKGSLFWGKYILLQETTDFQEIAWKPRKIIKIVPHVFEDLFSLTRSQEKVQGNMVQKSERAQMWRSEIEALTIEWWLLSSDERKSRIKNLITSLASAHTFSEKKAVEQRLEKIDFRNPQIDTGRLIGAFNDLQGAYREKTGKAGSIGEQSVILRDMVRREAALFQSIYRVFLRIFDTMEQWEMEKCISDILGDSTTPAHENPFHSLLPGLSQYLNQKENSPFIQEPFRSIHELLHHVHEMCLHCQEDSKDDLRRMLTIVLHLKLTRANLGFYEVEDAIKASNGPLSLQKKTTLLSMMESILNDLTIPHFLKGVSISGSTHDQFMRMIMLLTEMEENLRNDNYFQVLAGAEEGKKVTRKEGSEIR